MKDNTKKLIDYLDKMGVEYTIDTNPSEERIAEIKEKLKKTPRELKERMYRMSSKGINDVLNK